jgi:tellurite methyltransferase
LASSSDWDEKYLRGEHAAERPSAILLASARYWGLSPNRTALDLACGAGRNSVYLAAQGWAVEAVDFSGQALRLARETAAASGLAIETSQQDLEAPGWSAGQDRYGLVVATRFLHRPIWGAIRAAVAPGGLLVYETYTIDRLRDGGGPRDPAHLLQPNELLAEIPRLARATLRGRVGRPGYGRPDRA